jgi:hypothetical protein
MTRMSTKSKVLAIGGALVILVAAFALPSVIRARTTSAMNACVNNLRRIDGATQTWRGIRARTTGQETHVQLSGGYPPVRHFTVKPNPLPAANSRRPCWIRQLGEIRCSRPWSELGSPAVVAEGGRSLPCFA